MPLEGQQLGQRYDILHSLGKGGMGEVYQALDTRINRQVAIKVLNTKISDIGRTREANRLFQREIETVAKLNHPSILPVFDSGEEHINGLSVTYLVMPFCQEGSFANWLQQPGRSNFLELEDVAHFLSQAAEALQDAHDHQIVHLDVKPQNFLLRSNKENPNRPNLLLSDFGIAKLTASISETSTGIRGTPIYMAPEQWRGEPVEATDQYALAVMVYQLLVGHPPFQGKETQILYQHLYVQPKPPSILNPHIPKAIEDVILRALAKRPEERFPSISSFAKAFQRALQNIQSSSEVKSNRDNRNVSSSPILSHSQANIVWYCLLTVLLASIVGIILSAFGKLPSSIVGIAVGLGSLVTLIAAIWEMAGKFFSTLWQSTSRPFVISASMGTVALLTMLMLLISTSIASPARGGANPALATATDHVSSNNINQAATALSNDYATATVQASATVAVLQNTYFQATSGPPVLNDPLSNNSKGYEWSQVIDNYYHGACEFAQGTYQVSISTPEKFYRCEALKTNFGNFAFQVQMMIVQGDIGGIIFRYNSLRETFYSFFIGVDGSYSLNIDNKDGWVSALSSGSSSAIKTGLSQANLITVVAHGENIYLYVNKQYVASMNDNTYGNGAIGVIAEDTANPTEAVFSNAQVWEL